MKKNLRYLFTALLMMFGMTAVAEDVIWSEDFSGLKDKDFSTPPAELCPNYTFTGTVLKDDGTVKSGTKFYDEASAGGEAPELLIAKGGGSFGAKVALNGKTGEMTLSFKSNKNFLEVTIEGGTLGEVVKTGNTYTYPVTVATGITELSITFKNPNASTNARFDDAKLYQGTAKKPAGLSWGKASTTFYLGDEVTLELSNENNLPVTYTSSDETVATISSDGAITLKAVGKTTLTAAFAGNDEYEAQAVSIEVTVKEKEGGDPQPVTTITVAKALEIIAGLEDRETTSEEYEVKGFIVGTPDFQRKNDGSLYGNVNFDMADEKDGTNKLVVFRAKNFDNESYTEETINNIKDGDLVVMHGKLQKYGEKPELVSGYLVSIVTPTAISTVKAEAQQGVIYNLQGQQVMQPTKGLYIINGKKVVIK